MYVFKHLQRAESRLGSPVADCQTECLKLAPEQQAPCLNSCIESLQKRQEVGKAVVTTTVAVIGMALAGVLGFVVGGVVCGVERQREMDAERDFYEGRR